MDLLDVAYVSSTNGPFTGKEDPQNIREGCKT